MKVALLLSGNLHKSPYVWSYISVLNQLNIEYDIICWNRLGVNEPKTISFDRNESEGGAYISRYVSYFHYKTFLKQKLFQGNYDKVIVFTIQLGLMIYPIIKSKFNKNYIFDIRDYTPKKFFFPNRLNSIIRFSYFTTISSPGFKKWLPENNLYIIGHNCIYTDCLQHSKIFINNNLHKIVTIGTLRDFNMNKLLIDQLGNNSQFELDFVGSGPAEIPLKEYIAKTRKNNVTIYGKYLKSDENNYLKGASFINILVDDNLNHSTCLANRFYLSLILGIPMIVNKNTFQGILSEQYSLGVVIDKNEVIADKLLDYVKTFDIEKYNRGRDEYLKIVQKDIREFNTMVSKFLTDADLML